MSGRGLVVDADGDMRELFTRILRLDGRDVCSADAVESAREAVAEAPQWSRGPDVCFVDASLAPDNPQALGKELAALWPGCEVVYTIDASAPKLRRKIERSHVRHFARPFRIEDLRELVGRLLERRAPTEG